MFTGSIPDEITELSNVKGLWIGNNKNLTGVVPESIGEMKALGKPHIFYFKLPTYILLNIIYCTIPETLSLWGTSMSGTIPKSLYNLTHLTTLQLFRNTPGFSGTIATEIGYLVSLEHLDVNDNFLLSGTIPTEIGLFKNLSESFGVMSLRLFAHCFRALMSLPSCSRSNSTSWYSNKWNYA